MLPVRRLRGIVPRTFSLYSNVVLPALSCICNQLPVVEAVLEAAALTSPRINIRVSFFAQIKPWNFEM
jgi:hypothetical protein